MSEFTRVGSFSLHALPVTNGRLDFSATKLVSGSYDRTAAVWNVRDGKLLCELKGHKNVVYNAVFSPCGEKVCTVSFDKTVRVWDAGSGDCIHILKGHSKEIICAEWNQMGDLIATGGMDNTVFIWDAVNPVQDMWLHKLAGHEAEVACVQWNRPSCDLLLSGSFDKTAIIWEASSGCCLQVLAGHHCEVSSAQWETSGKYCITGSVDKTCCLWDVTSGDCVHSIHDHTDEVLDVCFHPQGSHFASCSRDKTCIVHNANALPLRPTITNKLVGHKEEVVRALFLAMDPHLVTCSSDRTCRLWDWMRGSCLQVLEGHTDEIFGICIDSSEKGTLLVSMSRDNTYQLWEMLASLIVFVSHGAHEDGEDKIPIACISMAGEELAVIHVGADAKHDMAWFRRTLSEQLQVRAGSLQFIGAESGLLSDDTLSVLDAIPG